MGAEKKAERVQHTPGPWRYEVVSSGPSGKRLPIYWRVKSVNATVAGIPGLDDVAAYAVGDAALIAAAPEMLEALEEYVRCAEEGLAGNPDPLARAKSAIAKARGES